MIINKSGITIRVHARDISVQGRATQGVRIIDLKKRGDEIASVCQVLSEEEEEVSDEVTNEASSSTEATPIQGEALHDQLPQEFLDRALNEDNNN